MNTVLILIALLAAYKIGTGIHACVENERKKQQKLLEETFEHPVTLDLPRNVGTCFAVLEIAPGKLRVSRCVSTIGYSAVYDGASGKHYTVEWRHLHQLFLTGCEYLVSRMAPLGREWWIETPASFGRVSRYAIIRIVKLGDGTVVPVVLDPKREAVLTLAISQEVEQLRVSPGNAAVA